MIKRKKIKIKGGKSRLPINKIRSVIECNIRESKSVWKFPITIKEMPVNIVIARHKTQIVQYLIILVKW